MLIGAQRQTTGYFEGHLITPTGKELVLCPGDGWGWILFLLLLFYITSILIVEFNAYACALNLNLWPFCFFCLFYVSFL